MTRTAYCTRVPATVTAARVRYAAFDARVIEVLRAEPMNMGALLLSVAAFPLPHGTRRRRYLSVAIVRLRAAGKIQCTQGSVGKRVWSVVPEPSGTGT